MLLSGSDTDVMAVEQVVRQASGNAILFSFSYSVLNFQIVGLILYSFEFWVQFAYERNGDLLCIF